VKKTETVNTLDVKKVLEEFQKVEESQPRRKGTFKINIQFEKAIDAILKAKPTKKLGQTK
jgi:hypothetical protein